jgi:hypothetical protein
LLCGLVAPPPQKDIRHGQQEGEYERTNHQGSQPSPKDKMLDD